MNRTIVDLIVEDDAWIAALPDLAEVAERAAQLALEELPEALRDAEICVLACCDERISALNAEFRGRPAATNVLSWPTFELVPDVPGERPPLPPCPDSDPLLLGNVAIALQKTSAEAIAACRPLKSHVMHLILHGSLHLLGFDHETPADAELMERIEGRAMVSEGYPDPYA